MTTLLLATIVAARQATAAVTYLEPAAPLSRVLPALSKLLNQPLDAAPSMKSDVVCIDVHDATPSELLKKLAWATVGEWQTQKDGTQVLIPSDKARKIQANEELKRRAGLISDYLKSDQKEIRQRYDLKAILRTLDPIVLAGIPEDGRIVYSTRPNSLQLPFPGEVSKLVLDSVANSKQFNLIDADGNSHIDPRPGSDQIDKAVLVVAQYTYKDQLRVIGNLIVFDRDGNDLSGRPVTIIQGDSSPEHIQDSSPVVTFSPQSIQFAKFVAAETAGLNTMLMFKFRSAPTTVTSISDADRSKILSRVLDPEHFEPLAYPSDLLRSLARASKDQVVACLPDRFVSSYPLMFSGSSTVESLSRSLSSNLDVDVRSADGWLAARPRDPAMGETLRTDRHRLAEALKVLDTRDYLRLADEEALASLGYSSSSKSIIDFWSALVRPSFVEATQRVDWGMLRLYASLTRDEQETLQTKHELKLAQPSGEQAALINKIFYGIDGGSHYDYDVGVQFEPTEVTPDSPMGLTLAVKEEPTVMASAGAGSKGNHSLGTEPSAEKDLVSMAATIAARGGSPYVPPGASAFYRTLPEKLRIGTRHDMTFRLVVSKRLTRAGWFCDDSMSDELTTFTDLRSKYQLLYDQQLATTRDYMSRILGGPPSDGAKP